MDKCVKNSSRRTLVRCLTRYRMDELDSALPFLSHRCETVAADAKRNETISPGGKIKLKMKLKDGWNCGK